MASREMRLSVTDIPEVVVMIADLTAERDEARAAVERVRELHRRYGDNVFQNGFCNHCGDSWPCRTIRALDGAP